MILRINSIIDKLRAKLQQHQYQRQINTLAWYLVIGNPQSGKKALLEKSGLHFIPPTQVGAQAIHLINHFPDFEWWFTQEAVFIDINLEESEETQVSIKKFCKFLTRYRVKRPLNAILLTVPLTDLISHSPLQHQLLLQLLQQLKSVLPIYIVITKTDHAAGFVEFFNDLSKEELTQVWGMTLPLAQCTKLEAVLPFCDQQYNKMMLQLKSRILWSLDSEKSGLARELIYAFPQQMQLFKKPLLTLIGELFSSVRYREAIQLRGVYFTSSLQSGAHQDLLASAIGIADQSLALITATQATLINQETYFTQCLFYEVLLPEGKILGLSQRAQKFETYRYRATAIVVPLLALIWCGAFYHAYQQQQQAINSISTKLSHFHTLASKLHSDDSSILNTLPLLNLLEEIKLSDKEYWPLLLASCQLKDNSNAAFWRILHNLFLPRIAAQLETQLRQPIVDNNILYAILKGYLAFSPASFTEPSEIIAPILYQWENHLNYQPTALSQLRHYLTILIQQPLDQLPLDHSLIQKIRLQLQAIIPADRAYGLLTFKAIVSDIADLNFSHRIGAAYSQLFIDSNTAPVIPALYTQSGFENIYLKYYQSIARQVANDNHDIGLQDDSVNSPPISLQMRQTYYNHYQSVWLNYLANLHVKSLNEATDVIAQLTLITSAQSPLVQLLNIISANSAGNHFAALRQVNQKALLATLMHLRSYLLQLQQSADPDKANFLAAKNYIQGDNSNPLLQLTVETQQVPAPVSQWLQTIADNCWNTINTGALRYINSTWSSQIIPEYNAQIQNRYPVNAASQSQISIDSFTHFFGPKGSLQQFLDNFVKPFIDTNKETWQVSHVNQHTLGLSSTSIALFQRLNTIQQHYFANNNPSPVITMALQPLTLSHHAAGITLNIGDITIRYQHGPRLVTSMNWPVASTLQECKVLINNFAKETLALETSGPWSWFQLIDRSELRAGSMPGAYILSITLGQEHANFLLTSTSTLDTLHLHELKGLELPTQLSNQL